MKIQDKSLMDIRRTATPQEIENKMEQVQDHINHLRKEALRLMTANGIQDYLVLKTPSLGELPGTKEYVWLHTHFAKSMADFWRKYQEKKFTLNITEQKMKTRISSYPLPNDWGDIPLNQQGAQ